MSVPIAWFLKTWYYIDLASQVVSIFSLLLLNWLMFRLIASSRFNCLVCFHRRTNSWKEHEIQRICKLYINITNGYEGKHVGFGGSLSPKSRALAMNIFGAANGWAMLAAWSTGANSVVRFELPDNKAQKLVFDAAFAKLSHRTNQQSSLQMT
jgi:hypothetical protein